MDFWLGFFLGMMFMVTISCTQNPPKSFNDKMRECMDLSKTVEEYDKCVYKVRCGE